MASASRDELVGRKKRPGKTASYPLSHFANRSGSPAEKKGPTVETDRRRLSVGQVEGNVDEVYTTPTSTKTLSAWKPLPTDMLTEEDRGMITNLNQDVFREMLATDNTGTGLRFSLGSVQDKGKTSFANKAMTVQGDKVDTSIAGMGYTCRKGLKPESPNQDAWMVMVVENDFAIYGVFDGHGQKGHDVSNFVKNRLPKIICKDSRFKDHNDDSNVCFDAFKTIQNNVTTADQMKKLDAQLSGTTASVCIHSFVHNKLTFAHVADSTVVLARYKTGTKELDAVQITRDHKPNLEDERARIEKNGGRVVFDGYANHRIYAQNARYPGLNMSRCLGDLLGHSECGLSCEPETSEIIISQDDCFLLLCSDGVWEFITPQEAVDFVKDQPASMAMITAEKLAKEAWDRWIKEEGGAVVDDITVVLIYLHEGL